MPIEMSEIYSCLSQGFFIGFTIGSICAIANVMLSNALRLFNA